MDEDEAALLAELRAISNRSAASRFQEKEEATTPFPANEKGADSHENPAPKKGPGPETAPVSSGTASDNTTNAEVLEVSASFGDPKEGATLVEENETGSVEATKAKEGGMQSAIPSTFAGERGGPAQDEELLAELRSISARSSNRFTAAPVGPEEIKEKPGNGGEESQPTERGNDATAAERVDQIVQPPSKSTPSQLPQSKCGKKHTTAALETDVDTVVAAPPPKHLTPHPAPVAEAQAVSGSGIKSSLPSTFRGDRGGPAEDAELLAELRAISSKSGSNDRFKDGDDAVESHDVVAPASKPVERPAASVSSTSKALATSSSRKSERSDVPPWKRGQSKAKLSNDVGVNVDVVVAGHPEPRKSDPALVHVEAETEAIGIKSSLPSKFQDDRGGPAEDAELLAELRAISSRSDSNDRFKEGHEVVEIDDTTAHAAAPAEQPDARVSSTSKPLTSRKPKRSDVPPWKQGKHKMASSTNVEIVVATPPKEPKSDETPSFAGSSVGMGIKSSLPSTFIGDRGGRAEDSELLAELRAVSSKAGAASRFRAEVDETVTHQATPDTVQENSDIARELVSESKAALKTDDKDAQMASSTKPMSDPIPVAEHNLTAAEPVSKTNLPSTFAGERGGPAEDAELLAELQAISAKSSGARRFAESLDDSPGKFAPSDKYPTKTATLSSAEPLREVKAITTSSSDTDVDVVVAEQPRRTASQSTVDVSGGASVPVESFRGITSDLPSTFRGERGGPAEDAELLAELRAISSKSSNRFASGTDGIDSNRERDNCVQSTDLLPTIPATRAATPKTLPIESSVTEPKPMTTPSQPFSAMASESSEILVTKDDLSSSVSDKNWKIREASFVLLQKLLKEESERCGAPFDIDGEKVLPGLDNMVVSMVSDSNAKALDSALQFVNDYAERCRGATSAEHASNIVLSLVKGSALSSSRPSTGKLATSLILKLMEVGEGGISSVHAVIEILLSQGVTSRKPKVVVASTSLILEAAHGFGASSLPLAAVSSSISKLLTHSNPAVRETALQVVAEMCRALGSRSPLQNVIDELKSSQVSQLDAMLEAQPDPTPIAIGLRNKNGSSDTSTSRALAAFEAGANELEAERFAARPAVNIFQELPKTEYSTKIRLPKWSEKVGALDIVLACGGDKPYKLCQPSSSANYQPLIAEMKKLLSHSHFAVASKAMQVLSMLAEGVGEKLYPYLRPLLTTLVGLTKDKKLTRAAGSCLDSFFGNIVGFQQLLDSEDALPSCVDEGMQKNALARTSALEFTGRCISRGATAGPRGAISSSSAVAIARLCFAKLGDSDASVRKAAMNNLQSLMAAEHSHFANEMHPFLEELKDSNPRVYKTLVGSSGGQVKSASETLRAPKSESKPVIQTARQTPTKSKASLASTMQPKHQSPLRSEDAKPTLIGSDMNQKGVLDTKTEPSLAEGIVQVSHLDIPDWNSNEDDGGVLAGLKSSKWLLRAKAVKSLAEFGSSDSFRSMPGHLHSSALLIVVKEHTKGFKESNINVTKSVMEIFLALCKTHLIAEEPFPEWACRDAVSLAVGKIGDKKLSAMSSELMTSLCEVQIPDFVLVTGLECIEKIKSPLVHEAFLTWCKSIFVDFGASALGSCVTAAVPWLLEECSHANPKIRMAALSVISELYSQLGPPVKALLLSSCSDTSIQGHVEDTLEKITFSPSQASTVRPKKCVVHSEGHFSSSGSAGASIQLEVPTLDLVAALPEGCIQKMGSKEGKTAWKMRKEAMDEVDLAMKKCSGLLSTSSPQLRSLVDLLRALRERLSDSQSNLKPVAARLVGQILACVDKETQPKLGKLVFSPLISAAMSDNRKPMREASMEALRLGTNEPALHGGAPNSLSLEVLVGSLTAELSDSEFKASGIPDVLLLIVGVASHLPNLDSIATSRGHSLGEKFACAVVSCLTSSKADTRAAAETLLNACVTAGALSLSSARKGMKHLLPAQQRAVGPLLARLSSPSDSPARSEKENHSPSKQPSAQIRNRPTHAEDGRFKAKPRVPARRDAPVASVGGDRQNTSRKKAQEAATPHETGHPLIATRNVVRNGCLSSRSINWPEHPEEPSGSIQFNSLRKAWSPMLTASAGSILFPDKGIKKQDDAIPGCELLSTSLAYEQKDKSSELIANQLEAIFMWTSYALCSRENTVGLQAVLKFLHDLFDFLSHKQYRLSESETTVLLPHLFEKASIAKGRFREDFNSLILTLRRDELVPLKILGQMVCVALMERSTQAKTRVLAYHECAFCVQIAGLNALGKKGTLLAAKAMSQETLPENKTAALDLMESVVLKMNGDIEKLARICGPSYLSENAKKLLEDRWKKRPATSGSVATRRQSRIPVATTSARTGSSPSHPDNFRGTNEALKHKLPSLELRLGEGNYSPSDKNSSIPPSSGPFSFSFQSSKASENCYAGSMDSNSNIGLSQAKEEEKMYSVESLKLQSEVMTMHEYSKPSTIGAAASLRARLLKIREQGGGARQESSDAEATTDFEASADPASKSSITEKSPQIYAAKSRSSGAATDEYETSLRFIDCLLLKSKPVAENDGDVAVCVSTLKKIHSAVSNQPLNSSHETTFPLRQLILDRTNETVQKLTSVIVFAFDCSDPAVDAGMSISLLSVALATLMALFRDSDFARAVSQDALTLLIRETGRSLLDPRLSISTQHGLPSQLEESTSSQMVRAINKLAVQAATGSTRHVSFQALLALQVQLCTQSHDAPSSLAFNIRLSRIVTKLFSKVVKAEEGASKSFALDSFDLDAVLCAMEDSLVTTSETPRNNSIADSSTTLSNMAKSLLLALLRSNEIGGSDTIKTAMANLGIDPADSRLGLLLRGCEEEVSGLQTDVEATPTSKAASMNVADLVSAVGSAPEGPERKAAIDALRSYNRDRGSDELDAHLMQVSTAFREYIMEQLSESASSPDQVPDKTSMSERIRQLRSKLNATEAAVQSVVEPPVQEKELPPPVKLPVPTDSDVPSAQPSASNKPMSPSPSRIPAPKSASVSSLRERLAAAQESRSKLAEGEPVSDRTSSAYGHAAALRARLEKVKLQSKQSTRDKEGE